MGNSNKILAIQNIYCEPLGVLKDYLLSDGFGITEILAGNEKMPENIEKFDAIFILGGPMSVNDYTDSLIKQKQLVINSLKMDIPLFGVCLGSQIIAASCGGNVFQGSKKEIGWKTVDITDEGKILYLKIFLLILSLCFSGMLILFLYLLMQKFCQYLTDIFNLLNLKMQ
ncbi:MAG TPA: gamma-glutamyl-gamma-aminobutyrate hydrolase family protein [Candidatus Nitrosocosmicus sp.]